MKKEIEEINALDKKRIQGKWVSHAFWNDKTHFMVGTSLHTPFHHDKGEESLVCSSKSYHNKSHTFQFIAKAPEMVSIINAQAEMLEKMAEVLEETRKNVHNFHRDYVHYEGGRVDKELNEMWKILSQATTEYKAFKEGV